MIAGETLVQILARSKHKMWQAPAKGKERRAKGGKRGRRQTAGADGGKQGISDCELRIAESGRKEQRGRARRQGQEAGAGGSKEFRMADCGFLETKARGVSDQG